MILLALVGLASAGEYRRLDLADGRALTVEVLGTEATGLVVGTPQGRMHLPYEQVLNIIPVEASAYTGLAPLRVLVLPFTLGGGAEPADAARIQGLVADGVAALPHTSRFDLAQMAPYAATGTAAALADCGADLECVRARVAPYDVDVVVAGTVSGDEGDSLSLVAAWPAFTEAGTGATTRVSGGPSEQASSARAAVHRLLGYELPPEPVVELAAPPPPAEVPTEPDRRRAPSPLLAMVPLPGFTAFAGGNVAHGLAATALVVPATAGMVYAAGASSSRPAEMIGLTALGWWALCAVSNVAWMPVVSPAPGGGVFSVGGSF